jgi:hypothetical protein
MGMIPTWIFSSPAPAVPEAWPWESGADEQPAVRRRAATANTAVYDFMSILLIDVVRVTATGSSYG